MCIGVLLPFTANAQSTATSVGLVKGNAAVTGFSGAVPPNEIPLGVDPAHKTFIDLDGTSLRVIDLQTMPPTPLAQLVAARKPFTATAAQIGQVFGVALDDEAQPNIYVAATSAYGLPIVVNGSDGLPVHVRQGTPGATFMAGLWGPGGGPGSIWKIDGKTGNVSLFANVALDGQRNSGPGLGGLVYDPQTKYLFVADRETGMIHSFDMTGVERAHYDHGVTGRQAGKLDPVPYNPAVRLDINNSHFDSQEPSTWGYAAPQRRVFGLGVLGRRLYYAVAENLQIWSIGINTDGGFADDAALEVIVPPANGPTEISKITFNADNRMYIADRPAPLGRFDFEVLTAEGIGRVLGYTPHLGAKFGSVWQQTPDDYPIGFAADFHNANGSIALGYTYAPTGAIDLFACRRFIWVTGERLRESGDPDVAKRLERYGPPNVDGLQGFSSYMVRRVRTPRFASYFVDFDDKFDDTVARGHMGDIVIPSDCSVMEQYTPVEGQRVSVPNNGNSGEENTPDGKPGDKPGDQCSLPNMMVSGKCCTPADLSPGGACNVNPNQCPPPNVMIKGKCCTPADLAPGGACNVKHNQCPPPNVLINGKCCSYEDMAPGGACGVRTGIINSKCDLPNVLINGICCSPNDIARGACSSQCAANQKPVGPSHACCDASKIYADASGNPACCTSGQLVNGKCAPPTNSTSCTNPPCCDTGYVKSGTSCCLASQMTSTGVCCPAGQSPSSLNKAVCEINPETPPNIPSQCCAPGTIPTDNANCCDPLKVTTRGICCSPGTSPGGDNKGECIPDTKTTLMYRCPSGYQLVNGSCCAKESVGQDGNICLPKNSKCDDTRRTSRGECCPTGTKWDGERCKPNINSVTVTPITVEDCPRGQHRANGHCCLRGQTWDGEECHTPNTSVDTTTIVTPLKTGDCKKGQHRTGGHCCTRDQQWDKKKKRCKPENTTGASTNTSKEDKCKHSRHKHCKIKNNIVKVEKGYCPVGMIGRFPHCKDKFYIQREENVSKPWGHPLGRRWEFRTPRFDIPGGGWGRHPNQGIQLPRPSHGIQLPNQGGGGIRLFTTPRLFGNSGGFPRLGGPGIR
jgi:hypothetical protein